MADLPPSMPPGKPRARMATLLDEEEVSAATLKRLQVHVRDRGVLTQMAGLEAGRVCSIHALVNTLGREHDCTHRFEEASLSRVHARILREGGAYVVEDAGSRNGVFVNERKITREKLLDGDRVRLGSAITLRFYLVDEHEEQALRKVYESSVQDGLTGACNRKHLQDRLLAEVAFAVRHKSPLAVVMADIDHFKRVNDSHGHLVGDEVLKATSAALRSTLRTEDLLARYGGEEFIVVVRGIDLKSAAYVAERLRAAVERKPVRCGDVDIAATISAGVSSLACCGAAPTPERLIGIADERLYRAKESGRNRVFSG